MILLIGRAGRVRMGMILVIVRAAMVRWGVILMIVRMISRAGRVREQSGGQSAHGGDPDDRSNDHDEQSGGQGAYGSDPDDRSREELTRCHLLGITRIVCVRLTSITARMSSSTRLMS